ncbi:MAG: hypothetical protein EZS28_010540 [Streblomastix strix]|uniref:Uncharacterized protein n=1 Tax=Streblomastix strix TaxID=222440 RepID=A0A5J4WG12_9EUKA|nr:MAG: hypothetical protein EZS28_010540 [Streblomastix strix]
MEDKYDRTNGALGEISKQRGPNRSAHGEPETIEMDPQDKDLTDQDTTDGSFLYTPGTVSINKPPGKAAMCFAIFLLVLGIFCLFFGSYILFTRSLWGLFLMVVGVLLLIASIWRLFQIIRQRKKTPLLPY